MENSANFKTYCVYAIAEKDGPIFYIGQTGKPHGRGGRHGYRVKIGEPDKAFPRRNGKVIQKYELPTGTE